ncbi:MAG: hypothetical protein FWC34_00735 [Bacteroidetes bacterium]|nr:hypothetical protein [Bacteroidota bacterium]
MTTRKMRVELSDNDGNRYTIAFEGQMTRDKVLRILDLVDLLGGIPNESQGTNNINQIHTNTFSRFEKVYMVVQKNFPIIWFTSKDIQTIYEHELKEPISLSTASTYLTRMTKKSLLIRTGTGNSVKYKVAPNSLQTVIKQQTKNK